MHDETETGKSSYKRPVIHMVLNKYKPETYTLRRPKSKTYN